MLMEKFNTKTSVGNSGKRVAYEKKTGNSSIELGKPPTAQPQPVLMRLFILGEAFSMKH